MAFSIRYVRFLTISLIVLLLSAFSAVAQNYKVGSPNAATLAMELHSGDPDRISVALADFPGIYLGGGMAGFRESVSPLVADGLMAALDSQCDLHLFGDLNNYEGEWIYDILGSLIHYVAALEDERTIPILLRASQFGGMAPLGLASFGPEIFPVILDYIESSERTLEEIDGGFFALERTVAQWRPLDLSTYTALRELSIRYMQGYVPEHLADHSGPYILESSAMFLACSLGDADLKPMVAALASKHPRFVEICLERWYDGHSGILQEELSE